MKKIYQNSTLLIILFLSNQIFAQKIEIIDHGLEYKNIREMSYYDFRDNLDGRVNGHLLFYLYQEPEPNYRGFLFSTFPKEIYSKNARLGIEYKKNIYKLTREFKYYSRKLFDQTLFRTSKRNYKYVQLYLEKFEIISEYYKELYNYSIAKQEEKKEVISMAKKLEKSITSDKDISNDRIENDSILKKMIADKKKSMNKLSTEYNNKIEQIELQKQVEIKALKATNYIDNKRKVIVKYDPQILDLKEQKNKEIESIKQFWDDKITPRKNLKKL